MMSSGPNGKQLLARISEIGNNNFKVDYIPSIAGKLRFIIVIILTISFVLLEVFYPVSEQNDSRFWMFNSILSGI